VRLQARRISNLRLTPEQAQTPYIQNNNQSQSL
jgi:hypothetical protein